MNGHDEDAFERAYGPNDSDDWGPRLDDDGPDYEETTELCPLCGHPVDVVEGVYICGNCIVSWNDIDELERERDTLAAQGWAR